MEYSNYELEVLNEIREWEGASPGVVIKALDIIGKPIATFIDSVPGKTKSIIGRAISGFMEMLKDLSYWTYADNSILKKARNQGLSAHSITELAGEDLDKLDALARSYFNSNKMIAALEGAGCGIGGLALIAADIPALFGISFRSIQQIGACYGFNMQDPNMLPVIMGIIHAGSGFNVAVKSSVLADMHIAAAALAGKAAYGKLAERTKTALMVELLKKSSRSLPEQIAKNITGRKLSQAIPVLGAALGAGFNYWFVSTTMVAAYMVFRKLSIERRHVGIHDGERPSFLLAIKRKLVT
jgi:hypothetical protein